MAQPVAPAAITVNSRVAWSAVVLLWFAYLANYVDRQVVFSIFPLLKRDLQFTDAQLGLIGTIFIWVYSLCMPVTGRIADIIRRDRVVVASIILWSLATLGTGMSTSVGVFLFWRGVMGVTESLYVPAALGIIATLHPGLTRTRAIALHATAQFAGIAGGGWYGGWMGDHIGWRQGFLLLAIAGIVYGLILRKALSRLPVGRGKNRQAIAPLDVFRSETYVALAVAFFCFCLMLWMLYGWLPNFIYERYRLSLTESGFTATIYLQTGSAFGVLCGGVLADKLVQRVRAGRFYVAASGLLGCAPFAYLVLASHSLTGLKLASLGFGLIAGLLMANVFAASYDVTSERNYGFGTGALNMIGGLAGGAGILIAGLWKESIGIVRLMQYGALASAVAAALLTVVVVKRFNVEHRRAVN